MKTKHLSLITFLSFLVISIMYSQNVKKPEYEGFGSITKGGEGGEIYHVTNLNNDGEGSFRDAVSSGNRIVVFDVGGEISVTDEIRITNSNITIDGSTAPAPGITLQQAKKEVVVLRLYGTQDLILRCIRVRGLMEANIDVSSQNDGTISIIGRRQSPVRRIVLDHITARNGIDSGVDVWGDIQDVTIQYCLIAYSEGPVTISHYSRDTTRYLERRNISVHHNIWARNNERNPQMRALTRTVDYVNNIIYDWSYWNDEGYGIRIKNEWRPNEPKVTANIINNAFIATRRHDWALVYGESAGSDSRDHGPNEVLPQGTVYRDSDMDSLYVSGNLLPKENMDHYSTVSEPLPIPAYAQVKTYEISELADSVVPFVGTHYPLDDEIQIFNAVTDSLQSKFP